ncbi:MAG: flagellar motor protein MotB [Deltaproteobacteria bacterium]|nr:flagellar motor protein MotB [Deltaproteobacteria bacterium]
MSEEELESASAPRRRSSGFEPPEPERSKSGGSQLDPDAWMVTFSDLLTLLMTFFVLIFASQDPVPDSTIAEAFGASTGVFGQSRSSFLEVIGVVRKKDISEDMVQVFLNESGSIDIEVKQTEQGLLITLPTDTYFKPGSAALSDKSLSRLNKLAVFLKDSKHGIWVEGHSDNLERPPAGMDSYGLSLKRATTVLELLLRHGVDDYRLGIAGYGPIKPRFDNVSRLGRARNRRVDIVILNRKGQKVE